MCEDRAGAATKDLDQHAGTGFPPGQSTATAMIPEPMRGRFYLFHNGGRGIGGARDGETESRARPIVG
jgi:hypothetical protein